MTPQMSDFHMERIDVHALTVYGRRRGACKTLRAERLGRGMFGERVSSLEAGSENGLCQKVSDKLNTGRRPEAS